MSNIFGREDGSSLERQVNTLYEFILDERVVRNLADIAIIALLNQNTASTIRKIDLSSFQERINSIADDIRLQSELQDEINKTRAASFTQFNSNLNRIAKEENERASEDNTFADIMSQFVTTAISTSMMLSVPGFNLGFQAITASANETRNKIDNVFNLVNGFMSDPIGIILKVIFEVIVIFLIDETIIGLTPKNNPLPARQNYEQLVKSKLSALLITQPTNLPDIVAPQINIKTVFEPLLNNHRRNISTSYPMPRYEMV